MSQYTFPRICDIDESVMSKAYPCSSLSQRIETLIKNIGLSKSCIITYILVIIDRHQPYMIMSIAFLLAFNYLQGHIYIYMNKIIINVTIV